jgi:hypothetical protein
MILRLYQQCEYDASVKKELCVTGIVCSNLQLQVLYMFFDHGSVCHIVRSKVMEIPEDISLFSSNIINIIKALSIAKYKMVHTCTVVNK